MPSLTTLEDLIYLSHLEIENFRTFGEGDNQLDLNLGPGLNLIVGENNSGKSAIVDALRLTLDWRRVFGRWNTFSWSGRRLDRRVFNLACIRLGRLRFWLVLGFLLLLWSMLRTVGQHQSRGQCHCFFTYFCLALECS